MTAPVPGSAQPPGFRYPFDPAAWPDPAAAYQWLREHAPLFEDPRSRLTFVTRHADCSMLVRDRGASAAASQQRRSRDTPLPASMLNTDPPEHDALRAPAMSLLGPHVAAAQATSLQTHIALLLAAESIGRDVVDGVAAIAIPFATAVLGLLLSLPSARWGQFAALARDASVNLDPLAGPEQISHGSAATAELSELLVAHAAQVDADTPLGQFWSQSGLGASERTATLMLIVIGGFEPLVSLAATGLLELANRPQTRIAVAADEQSAWAFVDELLRLQSPIPFVARYATEDLTLASGTVPAGAAALALLGAANRDPDVFERPDDLLLSREGSKHLAFGAGTHYCPGAPLVRLAGALLVTEAARQLPELTALAAAGKPRWRRSVVPRSLAFLPLRLAPAPAQAT